MNRILVFLGILLIVAGCAATLPQTPPGNLPSRIAAPEIRVGDTWAYQFHDGYTQLPKGTLEYRVSAVQDDTVSVQVRHGDQQWAEFYTRDWNWRERPMTNLQDFRYSPAYTALPFPLDAGKAWRTYVQATDPKTGRANRVRIDGDALGWEHVKVPMGEFDALKIRRIVYAGNFDHFRSEDRIIEYDWYSPQLGQIVKHESLSQYDDTSRSCQTARCYTVKKDWNVLELLSYRRSDGKS
jgi:hypothetical protein